MNTKSIIALFICTFYISVNFAETNSEKKYKTENVIVLIMDGPSYSETWGDSTHQYIPKMANNMAPQGVIYTEFRNH